MTTMPIAGGATPLTDRIVTTLPSPRFLWVAGWSALPIARLVVLLIMRRMAGQPGDWDGIRATVLFHVVFACIVLLALWATGKFFREVQAIQPDLDRLVDGDESRPSAHPIRGLTSVAGPTTLALGVTVVASIQLVISNGLVASLAVLPFTFAINLALMTAVWAYLTVLVGLNRLGGERLALDPYPEDRSLGLRPVGKLAFMAFWIYTAAFIPVMLVSMHSALNLLLDLLLYLTGVVAFFLSLVRLHRQLVRAKQEHLKWARSLYARAYEPIRKSPSIEALQAHSSALSTAESLERRAERIQEWPIDEGTLTRILAIITSVIAVVIGRLILAPFDI